MTDQQPKPLRSERAKFVECAVGYLKLSDYVFIRAHVYPDGRATIEALNGVTRAHLPMTRSELSELTQMLTWLDQQQWSEQPHVEEAQ